MSSQPAAPARAASADDPILRTVTVISAKRTIPMGYRFVLVVLEPIFALIAAFLAVRKPANYLATMTRESMTYQPETAFLLTQIGGARLFFALIGLAILPAFDDRRLWRMMCLVMLIGDLASFASAMQAVGGWAAWADVRGWTLNDGFVLLTTVPPAVVRFLIVQGVGTGLPKEYVPVEKKDE